MKQFRTSVTTGLISGCTILALVFSLGIGSSPASADNSQQPWLNVALGNGFFAHHGPNGEVDENVCSFAVGANVAHCNAHRLRSAASGSVPLAPTSVPTTSTPLAGCSASDPNTPTAVNASGTGGFDPCYIQSAYNVAATTAASTNGGKGQIVAIVDAYNDPNIVADLASYRSYFDLGSCSSGTVSTSNTTGCVFEKVGETGSTTSLPANAGTNGWDIEESLDVEMVSTICPSCQILLVEASSASYADLGSSVNTAVKLGATVVSNSYGGSDSSSDATYDNSYYNHPGVAIVASSGDNGYGVEYPAASKDVVAVGGTSLTQTSATGTRSAGANVETVWSGAGAGCSSYEAKPSWQLDTGCTKRTVADVSAIANPSTGVWVFDSYGISGSWAVYGGTSVASPIIGAMFALVGNEGTSYPAQSLYTNYGSLFGVTSGTDRSGCATYLCNAADSGSSGAGYPYNGPTGLGTPGGSSTTTAFSAAPVVATAPTAPTKVIVSPGNAQLGVSWSAPTSNGGSAITGYNAVATPTSGTGGSCSTTVALSCTINGLSNGTSYSVTVTATNAVGTSAPSTSVAGTPQAASAPSAPILNTATAGNAQVALSWKASSANGSPVTGYIATLSGGAAGLTCTTTTASCTIKGLTNGTTYSASVVATSAVGNSAPSNSLNATPSTVPSAPTLVSAPSGTSRSIVVTWSGPSNNGGSVITGYTATAKTNGGFGGGRSATCVANATSTTCTVTGLSNSSSYTVSVVATNADGNSASSNSITGVRP